MTAKRCPGLCLALLVSTLVLVGVSAAVPPPAAGQTIEASLTAGTPPVLAHYYIWFTPTSWNRAKTDYPAAGRYSSDQISIMREHMKQAKAAGIDGFIVSWKSTEVLDPRLENLMTAAAEFDMKLAITYQGLDFDRDPLPPARIGQDLDLFIERYADDPVFDIFDKPLIVWSGTWEYTPDEIASVTMPRRDDLLLLASEKNVEGVERLDGLIDGDLYYWSSVNPDTYPDYPGKLIDMAAEVHRQGGLWIAPVAPGFDARKVGGNSIVERDNGELLRRQWEGAMTSSPDAIGIISWNEFSENTFIEPSLGLGNESLRVLSEITGSPPPAAVDFDSSSPEGVDSGSGEVALRAALVIALVGTIVGGSVVAVRGNGAKRPLKPRRDP